MKITSDWHHNSRARSVPGSFWDAQERAWCLDLDAADQNSLRVLVSLFPEHAHLVDFSRFAQNVDAINRADEWKARLGESGVSPDDLLDRIPYLDTLYEYQRTDIAFGATLLASEGGFCLGWDRGLGKTVAALSIARQLGGTHTIIVTPNPSKVPVWVAESQKWGGDYWLKPYVHVIEGSKAKRSGVVKAYSSVGTDPQLLIVHYEALRLIDWTKVPCDLLIVDEAHRLASGGPRGNKVPQFYKALMKIQAKQRLALTGSVMVNGPEDIFGIAHFCLPKRYKARWKDWNDKYLHYIVGDFGRLCVGVRPDALEAMREELGTWMVVRHKHDHLDLPPRTAQDLYVDLSPAQRRVYDDLLRDFMAELPDGELILTPSVITRLTKLRQVATGLDLLSETVTDSTKIDLAIDLIQGTLPNKSVIFCWHRATVRAIVDRLQKLGIDAEGITGDTPMKERDKLVAAFQMDQAFKVIVATIKTLGESVTLHAASDLIFVESSWVPTDMEQAADRIYRIGQDNPVTITRIIARNTVDEWRVIPTVDNKAALKRAILGGK